MVVVIIRYKPTGEYVPSVEGPEVATYSEPAPSTAAPAAADSSLKKRNEKKILKPGMPVDTSFF